jgi:hypothetical protein
MTNTMKNRFRLNKDVLTSFTALLSSSAGLVGVIIAFSTLANQKETELVKQVENTIEWSDSNDALKRWEAIHRTKRLVKSQQLDLPLALNILGTVARNSDDEKLLIEVYEAIEDLRNRSAAGLANLSKSDQLELLCLEAAMTPEWKLRQVRLSQIERLSSTDELKSVAASKLLSLSQDLSRPNNVIDMLMSIFYAYSDPATLEKAIPILWDVLKVRDVLGQTPDTDVVGFLEMVAMSNDSTFDRMVTADKSL